MIGAQTMGIGATLDEGFPRLVGPLALGMGDPPQEPVVIPFRVLIADRRIGVVVGVVGRLERVLVRLGIDVDAGGQDIADLGLVLEENGGDVVIVHSADRVDLGDNGIVLVGQAALHLANCTGPGNVGIRGIGVVPRQIIQRVVDAGIGVGLLEGQAVAGGSGLHAQLSVRTDRIGRRLVAAKFLRERVGRFLEPVDDADPPFDTADGAKVDLGEFQITRGRAVHCQAAEPMRGLDPAIAGRGNLARNLDIATAGFDASQLQAVGRSVVIN